MAIDAGRAPPGEAAVRRPYLAIRGLGKRFGAFTALSDISLDIYEGEFVCFLGPSGCGKTTLLRAISGLDIQTSGTVRQGERDVSALPPEQRDFGIVFQSYALFPNLTVRRNVAYGLESRRRPRAEVAQRVTDLLALGGLSDQGDKYPAQLSGGQQQRVALARALATSPGLLLLDEPLSALDARVRAHLRHEIRDLQRRLGLTTIMVTHDQEEALVMADRIVVMNHGRIDQVGTPVEIYRHPATPFVADFVGKMNFLAGSVAAPGRVRIGPFELACDTGQLPAGAAVHACVRPEDVVIRGVQGGQVNTLAGRIERMDFVGNHFAATLSGPGLGAEGVNADFSTNAVRDLGLAVGRTLDFALPADRTLVFAASPG